MYLVITSSLSLSNRIRDEWLFQMNLSHEWIQQCCDARRINVDRLERESSQTENCFQWTQLQAFGISDLFEKCRPIWTTIEHSQFILPAFTAAWQQRVIVTWYSYLKIASAAWSIKWMQKIISLYGMNMLQLLAQTLCVCVCIWKRWWMIQRLYRRSQPNV